MIHQLLLLLILGSSSPLQCGHIHRGSVAALNTKEKMVNDELYKRSSKVVRFNQVGLPMAEIDGPPDSSNNTANYHGQKEQRSRREPSKHITKIAYLFHKSEIVEDDTGTTNVNKNDDLTSSTTPNNLVIHMLQMDTSNKTHKTTQNSPATTTEETVYIPEEKFVLPTDQCGQKKNKRVIPVKASELNGDVKDYDDDDYKDYESDFEENKRKSSRFSPKQITYKNHDEKIKKLHDRNVFPTSIDTLGEDTDSDFKIKPEIHSERILPGKHHVSSELTGTATAEHDKIMGNIQRGVYKNYLTDNVNSHKEQRRLNKYLSFTKNKLQKTKNMKPSKYDLQSIVHISPKIRGKSDRSTKEHEPRKYITALGELYGKGTGSRFANLKAAKFSNPTLEETRAEQNSQRDLFGERQTTQTRETARPNSYKETSRASQSFKKRKMPASSPLRIQLLPRSMSPNIPIASNAEENAIINLHEENTADSSMKSLYDLKTSNKTSYLEKFLWMVDDKCSKEFHRDALIQWDFEVNITEETKANATASSLRLYKFKKTLWNSLMKEYPEVLKDRDILKQLELMGVREEKRIPEEEFKQLDEIQKEMTTIYSTAVICGYKNHSKCDLELDTDISHIMAHSHDTDELKYVWARWRNVTGRRMRSLYPHYVDLLKNVSRINNFTDIVEEWLIPYNDRYLKKKILRLWLQLRPLYVQLHAYVRRKLREYYGDAVVSKKGCIPAHLLGNIWGHTWENLYNMTMPFPEVKPPDITTRMKAKGYTPLKMFQEVDTLFQSLGLIPLPAEFWKNSIIEKPEDNRKMVCHASAWDMYDRKDFRIKMCTKVTKKDFITIHHELGHIQYFMQYRNLPLVQKEGANPAFHEAIGDLMALSALTPSHMQKIGIFNNSTGNKTISYHEDINFLFQIALEKIVFLPYALLVDSWRWDVFQGKVKPDSYNHHWWKLRKKMEGISPPVERTEDDFDPGSKYHIAAGVPYLRYFISSIIQFQFHRGLCIVADQFDPHDLDKPLHHCDIYNNKEAGNLLKYRSDANGII
ncbi:angiotensin-converting enzyme-like isoform X2 [Periplaneta americana]|uniref:angiotensin-converting enzyme-like isoform X2 n=1 Tax=Periplaneta americana TaxID=6978 RepID=UPI0037E95A94